jgi:hypothetical protein
VKLKASPCARLCIYMTADLYHTVRVQAAHEDKSINKWVVDILGMYIKFLQTGNVQDK